MISPPYNLREGWRHALADPSILDGYTGIIWFAVNCGGWVGYQWYRGHLVGPDKPGADGSPQWRVVEICGAAVYPTVRPASHLALPSAEEVAEWAERDNARARE